MQSAQKKMIELKAYTTSQLAGIYKVDRKTFRKWLVPFKSQLGTRIGYLYSIPQVTLIFKMLGYPSSILINSDEEESFNQSKGK